MEYVLRAVAVLTMSLLFLAFGVYFGTPVSDTYLHDWIFFGAGVLSLLAGIATLFGFFVMLFQRAGSTATTSPLTSGIPSWWLRPRPEEAPPPAPPPPRIPRTPPTPRAPSPDQDRGLGLAGGVDLDVVDPVRPALDQGLGCASDQVGVAELVSADRRDPARHGHHGAAVGELHHG